MQPSRTKRPGGICDRSSGDRSDVLGTREWPTLRIKMTINITTAKECPMFVPFRHRLVRCTFGQLWRTNFVLFFYPFFSLLFEPARFFLNCLRHRFFGSQLAPMQLFLEEYPGCSSFRDGRAGMWAFSEGGSSQTCEQCVSETADIFATRLFVKLVMLEEISGAICKIIILFKMGCNSRTLMLKSQHWRLMSCNWVRVLWL